jgi:serine protease
MPKLRAFFAAAIAALSLCVPATASGDARAGADDAPMTTDRALIAVRTPSLPVADGRTAEVRRDSALESSHELLDRVAGRNGIEIDARSDAAGLLATELDGTGLGELRRRLASDPLVEGVRLEGRADFRYTPNEPFFSASDFHAPGGDLFQWPLVHQGFPGAWDLSKGNGVEVAVIDSGVDLSHPDLSSRVTATLNCAAGPICLGLGVNDTLGHGTHVSGLACADSDNGYGLASAGFDCSLYAIKTDLSYTSIINSIYAAANHGARVINMSFGGSAPDTDLRDAIDYAWGRGAIPVAAADNTPNPPPSYPAQYVQPQGSGPDLDAGKGLVVTSVSHSGLRSVFAEQTSGVSVAAVGSAYDFKSCEGGQQGILSTYPGNPTEIDAACEAAGIPARTSLNGDTRFAYLVGTSMASPQAAGLVALMRSAAPALSAPKTVRLIKLTASNCGTYQGGIGWGTIRADQAVGAAMNLDRDPPSSQVTKAKRVRARGRRAAAAGKGRGRRIRLELKSSDPTCSAELKSSGVKAVKVFASANGGRYHKIAETKENKVLFRAKRGRRYRFYSIAVDEAGNTEAAPAGPDAKAKLKKRKKKKK